MAEKKAEKKFTHLHVHSHYSLLDGLAKIDELVNKAKEFGMSSLALTDHGAMYGAIEFYRKCLTAEIKPIIGAELYLTPGSRFDKTAGKSDIRYHLVLLVKDKVGYRNLIKLVTKAHLEGFYYKPRIDKDLLEKYSEGLIALTACGQGEIPQAILADNFEKAKQRALYFKKLFGKDNFYLEIMDHPNDQNQVKINQGLIKLAKETKLPLVATNDVHYLNKEDDDVHDVLLCVQTSHTVDEKERLSMKGEDYSLKSPEQMIEAFKDVPEAISNTQKIADQCNLKIELEKIELPHFELPEKETAESYLLKLCDKGLVKRFPETLFNNKEESKKYIAEVKKRLEYEFEAIKKTGFASYFLIVQDVANWAKDQGIAVSTRGSAAGSLVSYLLNITNIEPIKYNLLFERFLNPERISMPDIDLDFADIRRDEVIDYVSKKYGADHVARIITFGTMASRAAVRDTGRALGYTYTFCDQIAKMIPFGFSLAEALEKVPELSNAYDADDQVKTLIDIAKKLEGVARHASTHACGVVITKNPLDYYTPRQYASQEDKEVIVTQYEMHSIENLGLLKMDFLGLKNLTIIENTLKLIKEIRNIDIDIDKIILDDEKTFNLFRRADTVGVFQLECLSGKTVISNTTIEKLYNQRNKKTIESIYLDEGKMHRNEIIDVIKSGKKETYTLITENKRYIKATLDHYFLTENGWKKLKDIKKGEKVLMKERAKYLTYNTCKRCGVQIDGQKNGKSNYCYKCSASIYKNPSKPESRKKISESRIEFYKKGGKPWNYGLSKEKNETLKRTGEKISKALYGRTFEDLYGEKGAKEMKKILSEKNKGKNNPMFGKRAPHRKGGYREDLGHYVRSNWEADFARILKSYNTDYEYEPKTFKLKRANGEILHYTPDFYVKSDNTFYEIKGWLHELDKEKIELFQKQYPQYNFVLINTTKFAELALQYKDLVKWECPRMPLDQGFKFTEVKDIKYSSKEMTYDIIMQSPGNNFVANSFVVHNSSGMRKYLQKLKPNILEDIIAMVALYRPGPMNLIPEYIARKHGEKEIVYLHPKLKPILEKTYGICVYQEQLMQTAKDLAGFTSSEADVLRKAVGKKIRKLLDQQSSKLIEGMVKNGIDKEIAQKIWDFIEPFASYGFNRSHAACYALIAYQTAYLKANFPEEFITALMQADQKDLDRINILVEEARKNGIKVLAPDINESFDNFTLIPPKSIRFGLAAIKNVGHNVVRAIVEERKKNGLYKSMADFLSRLSTPSGESAILNKKSLESLIKAGAFDNLGPRKELLEGLENLLEFARQSQKTRQQGQASLFGTEEATNNHLFFSNAQTEKKKLQSDEIQWEKELLGMYISDHPMNSHKDRLRDQVILIKDLDKKQINQKVKIAGVINKITKFITKSGKPMLFVEIEDLTGKIEALVFAGTLEKNPIIWQQGKIIMLSGRLSDKDDQFKILCDEAKELKT